MTRNLAAEVLEGSIQINEQARRAALMGVAALRRLDQLERWAKVWADNYDSRDTWAEMACFGMMLNAIHGEMKWPEKEKE